MYTVETFEHFISMAYKKIFVTLYKSKSINFLKRIKKDELSNEKKREKSNSIQTYTCLSTALISSLRLPFE